MVGVEVELPSITGRIAIASEIFYRYPVSGTVHQRQFLSAIIGHLSAGVPDSMQRNEQPILIVEEMTDRLRSLRHRFGC